MKFHHQIAVFLVLGVLFAAACTVSRDQQLAEEVVDNYHKLYNEQNYEEIFNTAHEDARRTKSKEALGLRLAEAFEKYGKHLGSELVYTKIKNINERERQIDLAYRSKFENGTRNETFLIVADDRKGALHSLGELSDEELEKLKSE